MQECIRESIVSVHGDELPPAYICCVHTRIYTMHTESETSPYLSHTGEELGQAGAGGGWREIAGTETGRPSLEVEVELGGYLCYCCCSCLCLYLCRHTHTWMCTCKCISMCIHVCVYLPVHTCTFMINMSLCVFVGALMAGQHLLEAACIHVYIYTNTCMYHVHICTYMHIHRCADGRAAPAGGCHVR